MGGVGPVPTPSQYVSLRGSGQPAGLPDPRRSYEIVILSRAGPNPVVFVLKSAAPVFAR